MKTPMEVCDEIRGLKPGDLVQITFAEPKTAFQKTRPMERVEIVIDKGNPIPEFLRPWYHRSVRYLPQRNTYGKVFFRTLDGRPSFCFPILPSFFSRYGFEVKKIEHSTECNYIGCKICEEANV